MAETVLVTGASGFLGAHVVAVAAATGAVVVASARRPEAMPRLGAAPAAMRGADLHRPGAATALCEQVQPAIVISCGALSTVAACARDRDGARAVNTEAVAELAAWSAASGARLVHVSTDLVFGARPPRGERYTEEDRPSPLHAYGETKAAGERAVLAADARAVVARLPLLTGDSGGRGMGAGDWLLAALARGETPTLFADEWRTPLDVRAAAAALLEVASGDHAGLLHVAGEERLSRYELGLRVLVAAGVTDAAARVRAGERADLGLAEQRARDVSLDARIARALLSTELRGAP